MIEEVVLPPIPAERLRAVLLPRLLGQVFHVTKRPAARSILGDREIRTNETGRFPFVYPQSEASWFRRRGCVCLFDLRAASEEQVNATLQKFYFLNPWHNRPVFFILDPLNMPPLVSGKGTLPSAMLVPHTEVGHEGNLSLEHIRTVLWVEVLEGDGPEPGTMAHSVWLADREDRKKAEESEA